jgi:hypothetical protein
LSPGVLDECLLRSYKPAPSRFTNRFFGSGLMSLSGAGRTTVFNVRQEIEAGLIANGKSLVSTQNADIQRLQARQLISGDVSDVTIWQDPAGVFIGEFEVMSLTFERGTRKVVVTATEISSSEIVVLGLPIALGVTVAARTIEMF